MNSSSASASRPLFSAADRKIRFAIGLTALSLLGYGCFERALKPVNPCTRSRVGDTVQVTSVDTVDILFMIDNSNSMAQEQASIAREIPNMIEILSSGDRDGDMNE